MEILLYATCFFSLDAFSILFISSIIVSLSTIYLSMFLLGLILCVTLPASYTLMTVFFPYQESVQLMLSLQILSQAFCLSLFLLGTLQQVVHLILSQMSLNSPHLFLLHGILTNISQQKLVVVSGFAKSSEIFQLLMPPFNSFILNFKQVDSEDCVLLCPITTFNPLSCKVNCKLLKSMCFFIQYCYYQSSSF